MKDKPCILAFTKPELSAEMAKLGLKPYVASQVYSWIYKQYELDPANMTNLSKKNRAFLSDKFIWDPMKHHTAMTSKDGSAKKLIFSLLDDTAIESVILKEKTYTNLCVSSQSGCPVDCKFCLTGVVGFKRQLSVAEIVSQVLHANRLGGNISHLVFMGMGEPLLNFDAVMKAIAILTSEDGLNISRRKITVSTSGHKKSIERLIDENIVLNLAFSVGHPNPIKRVRLMPIEKRNPLPDVVRLLQLYIKQHNRKLTLEYTLLSEVNDGEEEIRELANLSRCLKAKINLINLNPHPKIPFTPVTERKLQQFKKHLQALHVPVTIRYRKGQDISAACGQLGESLLNPEK